MEAIKLISSSQIKTCLEELFPQFYNFLKKEVYSNSPNSYSALGIYSKKNRG